MSQEIVDRLDQEIEAGLAVFPQELHYILDAAPERYRVSLLRAVFSYKEKLGGSGFEHGFAFGYALGVLGTGYECEFFTYTQYKTLSDCLRDLRDSHE